jgi:hypothetical protein
MCFGIGNEEIQHQANLIPYFFIHKLPLSCLCLFIIKMNGIFRADVIAQLTTYAVFRMDYYMASIIFKNIIKAGTYTLEA